jgi:hypothetical protein
MNFKNFITYTLLLLFLGLIQIMFLKNLALFGVAFCFLYLLGILNLPITISHVPLILISFGLGLIVDIFYDTIGIHAASATLLSFLRPYWLKAISPTGGYDDSAKPNLPEMGIVWYMSYSLPLIFAFSLVFFTADQWGTEGFFGVLYKSFLSSIFTVVLAIIVQLLFFKRRREIR